MPKIRKSSSKRVTLKKKYSIQKKIKDSKKKIKKEAKKLKADHLKNDIRIAREEIFGPVAVVIPFDDEADAIRICNDSYYGLSGSVWTGDGAQGAPA